MSDDTSVPKKRKRTGKKSKKISFDEEIVPKDVAHTKKLTSQNNVETKLDSTSDTNKRKQQKIAPAKTTLPTSKESKKHKQKETGNELLDNKEKDVNSVAEESLDEQMELDPANPTIQKEESNRAKKRKKHQQLLLEKKLKVDLVIQEKTLNYLSRWKHSKDEWKFEKLRQIWLQQNMFDHDRIPNQFWETLVEYFSNAKGKIRKTIIDDALKIIEKSESEIVQTDTNEESTNNEDENDHLIKLKRAKNIIQCLQE